MIKKLIVNPENPNGILVNQTAEEIADSERIQQNTIVRKEQEEQAKAQLAIDKANGNQKLLDLGLLQAEATAMTGYTPPVE
jgi:hypothetical protein|tara:strand:- start:64 stop:306 length:243 start_codon:yes stop_codon:yes gene_type:complete